MDPKIIDNLKSIEKIIIETIKLEEKIIQNTENINEAILLLEEKYPEYRDNINQISQEIYQRYNFSPITKHQAYITIASNKEII